MKNKSSRFILTLILAPTLAAILTACGSDNDNNAASNATSAPVASSTPYESAAAESDSAERRSRVSFDYSGDFEGQASTTAVIAGLMTEDLSGITANLDGYSSQSDTLGLELRNSDFVVGTPTDIFVADRNTLSLTMDGYALQLQPGSTLTVLEKTADTFRAQADELVLSGYEVMDFQRQNPSKTVTIRNLQFVYFD